MRVEDFNEERKTAMLCVVIANVIFMIGDCLMDAFVAGSVEIGLAAGTGFSNTEGHPGYELVNVCL